MREDAFCFWHAPQTAEEADEARRLGGLHRRKKASVSAVYGFAGLRTVEDLLTLLETTAVETLAIENSISRNRVLVATALAGAKLLEVGDLAERITALEAATTGRRPVDPFEE
jgi:hypothetical protein